MLHHAVVLLCDYRSDAAQRMNDILVFVKKKEQQSPECMTAIAKIVVQLLLHTDDSIKVTKPVVQVHVCIALLQSVLSCFNCHFITRLLAVRQMAQGSQGS